MSEKKAATNSDKPLSPGVPSRFTGCIAMRLGDFNSCLMLPGGCTLQGPCGAAGPGGAGCRCRCPEGLVGPGRPDSGLACSQRRHAALLPCALEAALRLCNLQAGAIIWGPGETPRPALPCQAWL